MAFTHGKDIYFQLDNTADSLTDVTAYVDSVSGLPGSIDMADVTTFGEEDKVVLPGTGGATFTVSGPWDSTFNGYIGTQAQRKVSRGYEYGPGGNSGVKISGECYIAGYDVSGSKTSAVRYTATCVTSDDITVGSF